MSHPKKQKKMAAGRQPLKAPFTQKPAFNIEQALAKAITNHQAGNLQQAEKIYEEILSIKPNHAETLHAQAIMACQRGQHIAAIDLFQKAIKEDPAKPAYHFNLGNAFKDLSRFAEAVPCYGEALRLKPDYCEALNNLGTALLAQDKFAEAVASYQQALRIKPDYLEALNNLGIIFHSQGKFDEALSSYQKVLQLKPDHSGALYNLANTLQSQGLTQEAILYYQNALKTKKDFPEVYNRLGIIFYEQGKPEAAIGCFQYALQIDPTSAEYYSNLAKALTEQGDLDKAIVCHQKVIELAPASAIAYNNLGSALTDRGRFPEAEACLRRALELKPNLAEAHCNLGHIQQEQGRFTEAEASYGQALELMPDYAEISEKLGNALKRQGRLTEAEAYLRRALELKADYPEAYNNLGGLLKDQGQLDEAATCFRQALLLKPYYAKAHSNLLLTMQYMNTATPAEIFSEHQQYAERFEASLRHNWQPHTNDRDPEKRLKVGYVSGDFFNHAVAFFIEPILANHDKSLVEVYCYYNNTKHDSHTDRIATNADHWLVCTGMNDEDLARRIRADGIDILIDLSGHTAHNRLPAFARKPAPVQVTWVGYAGTTGLTAMDYRITDAYMDPPGLTERYHSETLIRLPDTGAAYRPEPGCPPVNPLPALNSRELIFASLNNPTKINPEVAALWARILTALPHARLMLGNMTDGGIRQRLIELFAAAGMPAERLILQPRMPIADYLALHHQIDLALDPFPYNGGTSTIHSLWMGVPVITLAGKHMVSRVGVALLSRVGLSEFITHSEEEYLQRALQFAQDLPGLNRVRQSLRERMSGADCEPGNITRYLEKAYRDMWRKRCAM